LFFFLCGGVVGGCVGGGGGGWCYEYLSFENTVSCRL